LHRKNPCKLFEKELSSFRIKLEQILIKLFSKKFKSKKGLKGASAPLLSVAKSSTIVEWRGIK